MSNQNSALASSLRAKNKWQEELGTPFIKDMWEKVWRMVRNNLVANKVRWLQIQINHYVLPTNYSVNKYKDTQSPMCSFCPTEFHLECLPFLLWECPVVKEFWATVSNFLNNFSNNVNLGKKEAIFGDLNDKAESLVNTIIALSKYFVWTQKFTSKKLDEAHYFLYLKKELTTISFLLKSKYDPPTYSKKWDQVFNFFGIE